MSSLGLVDFIKFTTKVGCSSWTRGIVYKDIKDVDFKTDAFDFVEIKHRLN